MSYPATMIYDAACDIIAQKSERIPVTKLDPFTEMGALYEDDKISILWLKQIAYTSEGSIISAHRLYISRRTKGPSYESVHMDTEDDLEVWAEEYTEGHFIEINYDEYSVFDFMETEDGDVDTFMFVPGFWAEHLLYLQSALPSATNLE